MNCLVIVSVTSGGTITCFVMVSVTFGDNRNVKMLKSVGRPERGPTHRS